MNQLPIEHGHHAHLFVGHSARSERNTTWVVALTLAMMIVEIGAGVIFGSMALLADGWHMGTHAAALSITLVAYIFARRMAGDRRFAFGTGKMGVLAGFSSAIVLLIVALLMAYEGIHRLVSPLPIQFDEAILVAVVGLSVNLFSAFLLHGHDHHEHAHGPGGLHHHEDHNLKAAYMHVLADALTSVLAITALLAGKVLGWVWLDAMVGIVGALVITRWSLGLLRETGGILLDHSADNLVIDEVRDRLEAGEGIRVTDLHVWRINASQYAGVVCIIAQNPQPVENYRAMLAPVAQLAHITIEVHEPLPEEAASL